MSLPFYGLGKKPMLPAGYELGWASGSEYRPRLFVVTHNIFFIFVFLEVCEQEYENNRSNEQVKLVMCRSTQY